MVHSIWGRVLRELEGELPEKDRATWLAPLRPVLYEDGRLVLEAPSELHRGWIRERLLGQLEVAVCRAAGCRCTIALSVNPELACAPGYEPRAEAEPAEAGQRPGPVLVPYSFESFVVGPSNRLAFAAVRSVVDQQAVRFNPLFIFGGVGVGKTHLLRAAARELGMRRGPGRAAFVSGERFVNEMVAGLRAGRMQRFRNRFRQAETLIVDDVHFLGGRWRSQEEFFHTFDALHQAERQIVLSSDRPPQRIPELEGRLVSRFECGLLVEIQPPGPELRREIALRKAAARGLELPAAVVDVLVERLDGSVRELEGAIQTLEARARHCGEKITPALAREVVAAYGAPAPTAVMEAIVEVVSAHFQIRPADLKSPRRTAPLVHARQLAMYLCRARTELPLHTIGSFFGGRDHSTVVHALSAVERRLSREPALRRLLDELGAQARAAGRATERHGRLGAPRRGSEPGAAFEWRAGYGTAKAPQGA